MNKISRLLSVGSTTTSAIIIDNNNNNNNVNAVELGCYDSFILFRTCL